MADESLRVGAEKEALGSLLVLLHDVLTSAQSVEVTYRVWRHRSRATAAFRAEAEQRRRGGASISTFSGGSGDEPEPEESGETLRLWREGQRIRLEHHGGNQDGSYSVVDPPLWWAWSERMGAHSNEDDPSVGSNFGQEMNFMLDPTALLSRLLFRVTGVSEVAGRPTISAEASPRLDDPDDGMSIALSRLGSGADLYRLEIDRERGILLAVQALRDGLAFHKVTTLAITFDQPAAPEVFHFELPEGEELLPRKQSRHRNVTLVEAQQQAPFTVLILDTVPEGWQQMGCRLFDAMTRPPSPTQLYMNYHSADRHESVNITQMASDAAGSHRSPNDPENWDEITEHGTTLRTRPASWGQSQVELDQDGTFVFLRSDNLSRAQLVTLAFGLCPAPDTSSI